jgi:bifunctional DNase/RNase
VSFPTVELRVVDVKTAVPAGAGVEAGMLGLQETAPPWRIIRMIIGQPEARAIQSRWKGMQPPRPSTWDLFASTIEVLGGVLQQVVITAVEEERHFFATLELSVGGEQRVVPCRPSDAVALGMRVRGAKIMTFEEVIAAAGVLSDGSRPAPAAAEESVGEDSAGGGGVAGETAGVEGTVPVGDAGPAGEPGVPPGD